MSNLQVVMKQIKKVKEVAEQDPGTDVLVRRQRLGKKRQAMEKLKDLYTSYRKEISQNCLIMLVSGTESEKFAEIASADFSCYSFKADDFYSKILDQVPSKVYMGRVASHEFFDHISARFEDRAREIDIIGYSPLYFDAKYKKSMKTREDSLNIVKRAMNEKVGSEVVGLDAIEQVSIKTVNEGFAGKVVPIVIHTQDETLTEELIGGLARITNKLFLINSGKSENKNLINKSISDIKKVTKKNVEETLIKIKKQIV